MKPTPETDKASFLYPVTRDQVVVSEFARKMERERNNLIEVIEAMREWIDAVPADTPLPAMPGFDRDWADTIIEEAKTNQKPKTKKS